METFDTVEGQNKAVAKASIKDYVDRMSLSELRKIEKFISDLRQTDCSQSELIDGLDGLVTKMRVLSDDNRELLDATDDAFMRGQYNGKMYTYEICADMISMYRKKAD